MQIAEPNGYKPVPRRGRSSSLQQAVRLQAHAYAGALDPATDYKISAQLMRAWNELEETKRKLKMRPLPKPIDVSKPKVKQIKVEPTES